MKALAITLTLLAALLGAALAVAASDALPAAGLQPYTLDLETPALPVTDLSGHPRSLEDFHGMPVILNFWATWCPPCREEMPAFQRAWERVRDQGIVVIAVDVGEPAQQVRDYFDAIAVDFPILLDPKSAAAQHWPIRGLPTTFVLDADGRIVYTALGPRVWDSDAILAPILRLARPPQPTADGPRPAD